MAIIEIETYRLESKYGVVRGFVQVDDTDEQAPGDYALWRIGAYNDSLTHDAVFYFWNTAGTAFITNTVPPDTRGVRLPPAWATYMSDMPDFAVMHEWWGD